MFASSCNNHAYAQLCVSPALWICRVAPARLPLVWGTIAKADQGETSWKEKVHFIELSSEPWVSAAFWFSPAPLPPCSFSPCLSCDPVLWPCPVTLAAGDPEWDIQDWTAPCLPVSKWQRMVGWWQVIRETDPGLSSPFSSIQVNSSGPEEEKRGGIKTSLSWHYLIKCIQRPLAPHRSCLPSWEPFGIPLGSGHQHRVISPGSPWKSQSPFF